MKGAVKRKKESYKAWPACGTHEAADSYWWAKQCTALAVTEVKTLTWEEFSEAMEKDFQTISKKFWQTVQQLGRGKSPTLFTVGAGSCRPQFRI